MPSSASRRPRKAYEFLSGGLWSQETHEIPEPAVQSSQATSTVPASTPKTVSEPSQPVSKLTNKRGSARPIVTAQNKDEASSLKVGSSAYQTSVEEAMQAYRRMLGGTEFSVSAKARAATAKPKTSSKKTKPQNTSVQKTPVPLAPVNVAPAIEQAAEPAPMDLSATTINIPSDVDLATVDAGTLQSLGVKVKRLAEVKPKKRGRPRIRQQQPTFSTQDNLHFDTGIVPPSESGPASAPSAIPTSDFLRRDYELHEREKELREKERALELREKSISSSGASDAERAFKGFGEPRPKPSGPDFSHLTPPPRKGSREAVTLRVKGKSQRVEVVRHRQDSDVAFRHREQSAAERKGRLTLMGVRPVKPQDGQSISSLQQASTHSHAPQAEGSSLHSDAADEEDEKAQEARLLASLQRLGRK